MAHGSSPDSAGPQLTIDAGRLWAGGVATAVVAGLVAVVGVVIVEGVLDIDMVSPRLLLDASDTLAVNYALTAAVAAIVATGLAHLLVFTTPRPQAFYAWIVGLATAVAVALPFAQKAELDQQISTAVVNLVIGICIMTLISSVVGRTVTSAEPSA
ncbi:MAG: DUF6069 family protein [Actinomycetes bacterium]